MNHQPEIAIVEAKHTNQSRPERNSGGNDSYGNHTYLPSIQ